MIGPSDEPSQHDEEPGVRAELTAASTTVAFMLAGRAHVTFQSRRTGTRFTYAIKKSDPARNDTPRATWRFEGPPTHVVAVLTGPDHYTYLGCIFPGQRFAHGRKSRISKTAPSSVAFAWAWARLASGWLPGGLAVYHEGRCGKCGRQLTTPESIETGLGPVCAGRD